MIDSLPVHVIRLPRESPDLLALQFKTKCILMKQTAERGQPGFSLNKAEQEDVIWSAANRL